MNKDEEIANLKRRLEFSRRYWMRAVKKALDGDMRELRNRVAMIESGPLEIRHSTSD